MDLRKLHRLNALVLLVFLSVHMLNHAVGAFGVGAHLEVQAVLRKAYRLPGMEHALFALFAVQMTLGLLLVLRRGRPKGGWAWAQVISGLYLVFFLVQHLSAILIARLMDAVPDTDSHFAAAVGSEPFFAAYFAPYYTLAVTALFTHLAAALRFRRWPEPAGLPERILPVAGFLLGIAAVAGLMGLTAPYELPAPYAAYLDQFR